MNDVGVVNVSGVLDEGTDEVLGLCAGGAYEDVVARFDELHRRFGGRDFGLVFFFPVKVGHNLATEFFSHRGHRAHRERLYSHKNVQKAQKL